MRNTSGREDDRDKETSSSSSLDSRFSQTLRNVQGLLKGRSFPGKVLITRRLAPLDQPVLSSPSTDRIYSDSYAEIEERVDKLIQDEVLQDRRAHGKSVNLIKSSSIESISEETQKITIGARATDSARLMKFSKELSGTSVVLEKLHELAWSGVPLHLRPTVWRLLVGYAPCNSDRRDGILRRKRLEYLDCVAQHYDIPDTDRTDEEINMLRQPGIQRLVFKLKELVRRIDEPVSRHMEEQGLDFLQFSFRWFNCLLIREIPFHLVTRLWDTYLAEGNSLPDFLVYICASFLLTWSDKLKELEFQEMVMFLQHLPTQKWTHLELETVLSRAYMWHTVFNNSPSHLAG